MTGINLTERSYFTEKDRRTTNRDSGAGTFAEGYVEYDNYSDEYYLDAAADDGRAFRTYVQHVFVRYRKELELAHEERFDVSNLEFRLGGGELHLRKPTE